MQWKSIFEIGFKLLVIVLLIIVIRLQFFSRNEIVYVDSIKLVNGYKGMQAAKSEFASRTNVWKAQVDSLKAELELAIKNYQGGKSKLTSAQRIKIEKDLQERQNQFINYQQVVNDKIQLENQKVSAKVLEQVNGYVKQYGESHNYEIILTATQYGNIAYAKKAKDITEDVLSGLNGSRK